MHTPIANGIKFSREKENNNENQNFLNSLFFFFWVHVFWRIVNDYVFFK